MAAELFSLARDHVAGYKQPGSTPYYVLAFSPLGSDGAEGTPLPAGTDRSGTAQTTAGGAILAAANTARRGLEVQNVGANNIGITENGTDPVIGGAGTYTLLPNGSFKSRTNRQIKVIAVTGATAYTATEW